MNMGLIDYMMSRDSQPRPHCTFPWILDKMRWTQAIVTAVSHFLVQSRPGSKFTCQHSLANYQML